MQCDIYIGDGGQWKQTRAGTQSGQYGDESGRLVRTNAQRRHDATAGAFRKSGSTIYTKKRSPKHV